MLNSIVTNFDNNSIFLDPEKHSWDSIRWRIVEREVKQRRSRIFKASKCKKYRKFRKFQKRTCNSLVVALQALRKETAISKAKGTPGLDQKIYLCNSQRLELALGIHKMKSGYTFINLGDTSHGIRPSVTGYISSFISPSAKSFKSFKARLSSNFRYHRGKPLDELILKLKRMVRGYCEKKRKYSFSKAASRIDHHLFKLQLRWMKRAHPKKSTDWCVKRYFKHLGTLFTTNGHFITLAQTSYVLLPSATVHREIGPLFKINSHLMILMEKNIGLKEPANCLFVELWISLLPLTLPSPSPKKEYVQFVKKACSKVAEYKSKTVRLSNFWFKIFWKTLCAKILFRKC